ncbi:MAG: hypothetical protein IJA61_01115 [Clostridia bacterium]|nr:hypothetical protein [Clostridia bacterium]
MNWVFITFIIVVFILSIGVLIDANIVYDMTKNDGYLIIKLFKIPIIKTQLNIQGNTIKFNKTKKKPFQFIINLENLKFVQRLKNNIIKRIYINHIDIDCIVSFNNSCIASMLSAGFLTMLEVIKYKLICYQHDAKILNNVVTGFQENRLIIIGNISVVINIMDMIMATCKTIFQKDTKYVK